MHESWTSHPSGIRDTWYRPTCVGAHVPHLATQRYDGLCWAESYCLIVELQDAVEEVLPTLRERGISVYLMSDSCSVQGITALSDKISKASDQPLSRDLRANIHIRSTALYIYTSGTTGNNSSETNAGTQNKIAMITVKLMRCIKLQTLDLCSATPSVLGEGC